MKLIALSLALCAVIATAALAHSGGTDAKGCHHDHIHGGYHCH